MKRFNRKIFIDLQRLLGKNTEHFNPHGVQVYVPSGTDVDLQYLLLRGRPYEEAEAELIGRFLQPQSNVIELGGCLGIISALIRNKIGPEAIHLIVEPNPKLIDICRHNAMQGASIDKTSVIEAAIDYSGSEFANFQFGANAHGSQVVKNDEGIDILVPTVRFKKLVKQLPEGPFTLVCDIEGAEIALFENETDHLSNISQIFLETPPSVYRDKVNDLSRMLSNILDSGMNLSALLGQVLYFSRPPLT